MIWTYAGLQPLLPPHCETADDFLLRFSSTFHICTPTYLAFVSNLLGILSITAWLFAQLPQIWKNYSLKSTSGLSIFFLTEWCLGDLGNLLGALFTHQATWQVTIGIYYVFVDLCLVLQWIWYERWAHGRRLVRIKTIESAEDAGTGGNATGEQQTAPPVTQTRTRARPIFRTPTFQEPPSPEKPSLGTSSTASTKVYRVGPSSSLPSPSPRTVLLIACLLAVANASPLTGPLVRSMQQNEPVKHSIPLETIGTVLSWMSTVLYLGSRLPQIYMNWQRKSTSGLSPHLFIAAFCGNLFYSAAIATNPLAWSDFDSYGGGGWAGAEGSDQAEWVAAAMPFFLGAAGVLALDASVGVQFLLYGEGNTRVMIVEEGAGSKWKWRRVSGWMRGWIPNNSETRSVEARRLLEHDTRHGEGYNTFGQS